jgi:hypothetical protein
MDSSGEPVSKYRVKVFIPGRLEYILFSGAPTYLGHRSLFFSEQFRWWEPVLFHTNGDHQEILSEF